MDEKGLMDRLDHIEESLRNLEFRQKLLFDNDHVSRILFIYNIDEEQAEQIMAIMIDYMHKIQAGKEVNHLQYEQEIYKACPMRNLDVRFVEILTFEQYCLGKYQEVFEKFYKNKPEYQAYLEERQREAKKLPPK